MELGAGAGGLRGDRVRVGAQPVDAVQLDVQVLTARREHLVVEQPVPGVLRQRGGSDVLLPQGGQNADHDQSGADRAGALLGVVERGPDLGFPGVGAALRQPAGRNVDLEVETAQLGGPGGVRDRLEDVGVAHRRFGLGVDQVQLDLQAHLGPLGLEPRLAQHLREHLEALLHLDPVPAAVLAGEDQRRDVASHRPSRRVPSRTPLASSVALPDDPHQATSGPPRPHPFPRRALGVLITSVVDARDQYTQPAGPARRAACFSASRAVRSARFTASPAARSRSSASCRSRPALVSSSPAVRSSSSAAARRCSARSWRSRACWRADAASARAVRRSRSARAASSAACRAASNCS